MFEGIARNKTYIKDPIDKPIRDQTVHKERDTTRRELNETTKRLEELRAKIKAQTRQKVRRTAALCL